LTSAASHADHRVYLGPAAAAPTRDVAALGGDRLAMVLICLPAIAATLLSKIGLPPLAARGIGSIFPVAYAAIGIALLAGRAAFHTQRLWMLLVVLSALGIIQVVRGEPFSITSMMLMSALGFTYVVCIRSHPDAGDRALDFFCNLSLFVAACGIAQFAAQFFVGPEIAFPIEHFVPAQYVTQLFNNFVPLAWGATTYKANGIFMLEPSVFSQLCALGMLSELTRGDRRGKNRPLRLATYGAAMAVSYSGTGLIVLGLCLPIYMIAHRRWDLLALCGVFAAAFVLLAEPLNLDIFAKRATEFSATGSSAYARFVAWMGMFEHLMWPDLLRAVFGYGAGTFQEAAAPYRAAEMAHSKILFEFGVLGGLAYFGFVFFCIFTSPAPPILRLAVGAAYFMNGAYSPTVTGVALTLLLLWARPEPLTGHIERAPVVEGSRQ